MKNKKVFLFGIDGAPPELIFDKWREDLPNINSLMKRGSYAKLNSTIPPITIGAWNSMISGKDLSEIGVFSYTYKNKDGKSQIVNSSLIKTKLLWDYLGNNGKKTIALYVPLSYPVKQINGIMVSDFLTPSIDGNCAYPAHIKDKIKAFANPEIFFDVALGIAKHKGMEVEDLIKKTYQMTDMQLRLVKDLLVNEEWDFFMTVMIGSDRLQHMLWRHFDEEHRRFIPNSPYKDALKNYYKYLDKELGEIIKLLDEETTIIITSDHGMIKQEGKININNWLIQEGYLVLKPEVNKNEKAVFSNSLVDMEKSVAWGGGSYHARIYINREKVGQNYEKIRDEIYEKLKEIPDDKGNQLNTDIYKKEDIYLNYDHPECPDLTVFFDSLRWASNPDFGQEGLYSWETAIGADNAGHSKQGSFVAAGRNIENNGYIGEIDIRQVAPTILKLLGEEIPEEIKVEPIDIIREDNFYEATLIDTIDGMQFKVYANKHPKGFVIAKPKYIPEDLIEFVGLKKRFILEKCMTRFNLFNKKEIVQENLKRIKNKFPEIIYESPSHKNWFLGVPTTKIKKVHDARKGLKQLMKVPEKDLDDYLKSVQGIIKLIIQSGVTIDDLGISHSTLLANYTPGKSDIDIIVFGKENGWKVINFMAKVKNPRLRWKSKEDWAKYYRDRIVSEQFNMDEYVFNMERKRDDGFFDGNVFSIFCVENSQESWYNWDDEHNPIGTVKIRATVKSEYNSIVRPGYYEISDSEIIEGKFDKNLKIKRIVNWARPFSLQAKSGEKIEACGLLEKVKSGDQKFYQIVIGYFDTYTTERGEEEYLKALVE
ncbi:alkaline phosphatase family protein [Candidatus Pacearchaeota archaeon]|nr:alkaline phosphatase family protein [Candidatus Pacearchaeota archaeon]